MHYGYKNKNSPFCIEGKQLVESKTDPGVIFSTKLKLKDQHSLMSLHQLIKLIECLVGSRNHPLILTVSSLNVTFIRTFLEFAVSFWSPILKDD